MNSCRFALMQQLARDGLVQMSPSGEWETTRRGRDLLDRLDLLRELSSRRPGAVRVSSPRRQAPSAQTPERPTSSSERAPGDDDRKARGRRAKEYPRNRRTQPGS